MLDLKTMTYIQSEAEFNRAKSRGFWEIIFSRVVGRRPHLLPLDQVINSAQFEPATYQGLQDVRLEQIVGSAGRQGDFTHRFAPCAGDERSKERWRLIYTLAVSGAGFPPVELYQVGDRYFVQNGHHRISVAATLGWPTIQAYVTIVR